MLGHVDPFVRPAGPSIQSTRLATLLRKGFAAHGIFLFLTFGFALVFLCLGIIVPGLRGKLAPETVPIVLLVAVPVGALALAVIRFTEMAVHERPERPMRHLITYMANIGRDPVTWAVGLPIYLGLSIFIAAFGHSKASIAVLHPFSWDATLDHLDAALHFGRRPWEWLQPIFGRPIITFLLNVNYNAWFQLLLGFWAYYAIAVPPGFERTRFFLAFVLTWMIGGSLVAMLLSSAGPCYFGAGRLGIAPNPYAGLMAYLRMANEAFPVWALPMERALWQSLGDTMPFGGVSAMPSMHNATALLFLLTSGRFATWVRLLLALHLVLIFIGSVHLGWHYAVDAYCAWAIALAVWYPAGMIARWWESTPQARAFSRAIARRG